MKCITCKGRGLCGRPVCPILRRLEETAALPRIGKSLEGMSPPEVFVGRHGYPLVRAGPMVPAGGSPEQLVEPASLAMDIGEIIAARSALVRTESKIVIKEADAPGRLLEAMQQIALSSAPVGTEVSFYKPPRGRLQFDGVLSPSGPSGEMREMQITTNPLIPRKVDQMVEDRDAAAATAVAELYTSGIGTDHISRMLSLGLLGKKRKLVPTRWSITASDDMIGKLLKETVLDCRQVNDYYLFSGEDLGNHFEILLLPRPFSFELVEIWRARSVWAEEGFIGGDREDAQAKKQYSPLAGGYYAARLAVLEHLAGQGRQAGVLAVREISEAYWAPLGVWVVREVARSAMRSPPARFGSLGEAMAEMEKRIRTKAGEWRKEAQLLARPVQRSLMEF
ncbi:MAG: Nre family DNA repair protein [Methanothrix sp.]|nr:Nre family DNA repair protein [Methanothrix sp.]